MTILITILLLLPMVVCNVVISTPLRLFIVMVSTVLYLLVLSHMSRAKTPELVVAATTYVPPHEARFRLIRLLPQPA